MYTSRLNDEMILRYTFHFNPFYFFHTENETGIEITGA